MRQVKTGRIILAFCWAHVRRDFLAVLTSWPELTDWAWSWIEEIALLYERNDARLATSVVSMPAAAAPTAAGTMAADAPTAAGTPAADAPTVAGTPAADAPTVAGTPAADAPTAAGTPAADAPTVAGTPTAAEADRLLREHVAHLVQRRDSELIQPHLRAPQRKVLDSLKNHWSGLTVFLDHPEVPLDNNEAERRERVPVIARKNYYGSGALWS